MIVDLSLYVIQGFVYETKNLLYEQISVPRLTIEQAGTPPPPSHPPKNV